jgi:hypothetical protein
MADRDARQPPPDDSAPATPEQSAQAASAVAEAYDHFSIAAKAHIDSVRQSLEEPP